MPDSSGLVLLRSGAVANGQYLFIDLTTTPPTLVSADEILPAAMLAKLTEIDTKLGAIMTGMSQEQADIQSLADAISVVGQHITDATGWVQSYVAAHPDLPPADLSPLTSAVASLQNADTGLSAVAGAAPAAPAPSDPIPAPDPNAPAPVDTTTPPPDTGLPPT
jgi:hypothetical protein